jgi:hypothetical protein
LLAGIGRDAGKATLMPEEFKIIVSTDGEDVKIAIGDAAWFVLTRPQALQFAFAILKHCGVSIEQHDLTKGKPS